MGGQVILAAHRWGPAERPCGRRDPSYQQLLPSRCPSGVQPAAVTSQAAGGEAAAVPLMPPKSGDTQMGPFLCIPPQKSFLGVPTLLARGGQEEIISD